MRTNPFCLIHSPAWIGSDSALPIGRLLEILLELAAQVESVHDTLPWLEKMSMGSLILEWISTGTKPVELSASRDATFMSFFATVTEPIAEMIERLYISRALRQISTVEEIVRRMAQSVGVPTLPSEVVAAVCYCSWRQRLAVLQANAPRLQATTWTICWQQTTVQIRTAQGKQTPILLLVSEQETGKILAFRSVPDAPSKSDILLTICDALVFTAPDAWHLCPPACLHVQRPLPPEIAHAGRCWEMKVEEVGPRLSPFVQEWDMHLSGRVLDQIQHVCLFDRACERAFGFAPLLAKRQAARRSGWSMRLSDEPTWLKPHLREILPTYEAVVGRDGTVVWHGCHYRDMEEDVLRYWPGEAVVIRPSPVCEALIWVYWDEDILCCAHAEELYHQDGSFRPYWFPYPQLGE